ncbi:MAG TPA: hypothetical protein DEF79_02095 [Gammaproteobacteria bacterium]|nr:hypothetical protein [Gammaproteobacteria bacterium]|tara:strand:+ start:1614 stop:2348 length:735 start_codon:yes stop_codon:yes gene_type:complete
MKYSILLLLLLLSLGSPYGLAANNLEEFSAHYSATTNGIYGTAERHLVKLSENNYRLNVSLEAKIGGLGIGDLEQASEFSYLNNTMRPLIYSYQVSGVSSVTETIIFNWDAMLALSANEKQSRSLTINNNTLDELSYQLALALDISDEIKDVYSFEILNGDALVQLRFEVLGEEIISTPLGDLRCVKLERQREANSNRSTTIWLALDWSNLLAKIEQTSASGLEITMELTNALIANRQVSGLPK